MGAPFVGVITLDDAVTAPGAATTALAGAGAGNVGNGAHRVKVTFVTPSGETEAGTQSNATTVVNNAADGKVAITAIPVSTSPLVTGRKVYMSDVAATGFFLLSNGSISDNTSTTLTANDADATLVASTAAPATNDATVATNFQDALIAAGLEGVPAFAHLRLSVNSGSGDAVLSSDPDISAEADGSSLGGDGSSADFYATSMQKPVQTGGLYLFSETPNQTVSVYAQPIL